MIIAILLLLLCCCRCIPEPTKEAPPTPNILAYGVFKADVVVYHGEFTTEDKEGISHIKALNKTTGSPKGSLECCIGGCKKSAAVGAHVYYSRDDSAAANVCFIVPTCSADNNVHRVWERKQAFSQKVGVPVKGCTPFIIRKVKDDAMGVKGFHGKGAGKGGKAGFPKQCGLSYAVSEFRYYETQKKELCFAGILNEDGSLP